MLISDTIVIHGGGYVGLTAAYHYALSLKWKKVIVYDPDQKVVDGIMSGNPRAQEFLGYIDKQIKGLVENRRLFATTQFDLVCNEKYHSIAVPTEKDGKPYDIIVVSVLNHLFSQMIDGFIIIESTLAPGMIDNVLLQRPPEIGLAVCPRRDWFADRDKNLSNLDRVVGGVDRRSTEQAREILSTVTPVNLLHSTDRETAELCKALENALLHVPVMFAHQLALSLPKKNVREALELAGTHWRLPKYFLGFGTGGRCVPLGTQYLVSAVKNSSSGYVSGFDIAREAIRAEQQVRNAISYLVIDLCLKKENVKIFVVGAGYRPNFKDIGGSPGVDIAKLLAGYKLDVTLQDLLWDSLELQEVTGIKCAAELARWDDWDIILLNTCHDIHRNVPQYHAFKKGQVIIDATGAWIKYRDVFKRDSVDYRVVGEPNWRKA